MDLRQRVSHNRAAVAQPNPCISANYVVQAQTTISWSRAQCLPCMPAHLLGLPQLCLGHTLGQSLNLQ